MEEFPLDPSNPPRNPLELLHDLQKKFGEFRGWIEANIPNSRHRSIALTELETAELFAERAIKLMD